MIKTMQQVAQNTVRHGYETLRASSATDDTSLTAANLKDGIVGVVTKSNAAEIIFHGSNADGETFTWTLYGQVRGGPAELIATGTGALGEIVSGLETNGFYANTIAITVQKWLSTIQVIAGDNVALYMSKILFDCYGYDEIAMYMTNNSANTATIGASVRWI